MNWEIDSRDVVMCMEISDSSISTGVLDLLKSIYFDLYISFVVYVCNSTEWQIK